MRGHATAWILSVFFTALLFNPITAKAADYTEGAPGQPDLSGNGATPPNRNLTAGPNTLTGTTGNSGDTDIFHISIPAGMQVSEIKLNSYGAGFDLTFVGMKVGSTWPGDPNLDGLTNGWTHFNTSHVGTNILDDIVANSGGTSSAPLSGSDYTFWIQNATASTPTAYSLSFAVPEPTTLSALALGGLALLSRRRRV